MLASLAESRLVCGYRGRLYFPLLGAPPPAARANPHPSTGPWPKIYQETFLIDGRIQVMKREILIAICMLWIGVLVLLPARAILSVVVPWHAKSKNRGTHKVCDHLEIERAMARLRLKSPLLEDAPANQANPEAEAEADERRRAIATVLGRLPSDQRQCLEWKYIEDLSVREIAGRLGRTDKAVEALL